LFSKNKEGQEILKCKEIWSETGDELEILATFGVFINKAFEYNSSYRLIGHAAKYFDYGYICKRFVINGLRLPRILDTAHLKPWDTKNLCTNKDIWKMGFDGPGSSLIALCVALQIPITKGDIDGSQVGEAYYKGEYQRIGKYCSLDAIAVINIVRKIKQEPIFQFEDVIYY
jgi:3'-5' exonuclease